jgi:predicted ferric reductase
MLRSMSTTVSERSTARYRSSAGRALKRPAPPPRRSVGQAAVVAGVLGLVAVVVLGVVSESAADLHVRGGVAMFLGGMAGLVGMYLALVQLLLISRIPQLERILGQDGLLRWHRRVGPWPIAFLVVHAIVITIGFAQASHTGAMHELGVFLRSYPDMLLAVVGLALMVMAGVASIGALRRRMRRETWWVIHLYMYLALALSFAHVLALGPTFVGHPLTQALWALVWAATAGVVIVYRFGLPVARSMRYRLRVAEVRQEAPGVVSVICTGRHLDRLRISGGQFFAWRFLKRGLWWQAHPYTVSALPRPPYLRLTVRQIGDHSAAVARLRPGTRVAIEGPYGAVTPDARVHDKVVLVAGGIGITSIRALLEGLPKSAQPTVIVRAPTTEQLVLRAETAALVKKARGTLHELVGPRSSTSGPRAFLQRLVPDLADRDVYVCGPEGFVHEVIAAAQELGAHRRSIHYEVYQW